MSWSMVKLGDVATVNPRIPKDVDDSQLVTFVAMASVSEDGYLLGSEARVLSETRKGFTYFDKNDVLLAKITPCFENGKCLRPGQIATEIGFGSTEFHVIRPDRTRIDEQYLFYLVWNEKFRIIGEQSMSGAAGQKRIGSDFLKGLDIPLPPLPEQKRITAILDKADAIRRKRQQAILLADDFLRAVFLDMFGDPVMNPKGWEVKGLSEVARIQIGPFGTQLHKEDYIEGGIPLINPTHIVEGKIVPDLCLTISEEKYRSLPEYHLKVDDIIMGRRGAMGRCAIVGDTEKNYICGTGSLIVQPFIKGAFSLYLYKLLSSAAIKEYLESESIGATLPNLNKGIVGGIQVPVPDKTALNKFEEILGGIHAVSLRNSLFNEQLFFDSLSQKAFSCGL